MRDEQRLVDTGLYAHIRHPGYAGTLLMLLGYALAWQTPTAAVPVLPMQPIYIRRITAEERLLAAHLGLPTPPTANTPTGCCPGIW